MDYGEVVLVYVLLSAFIASALAWQQWPMTYAALQQVYGVTERPSALIGAAAGLFVTNAIFWPHYVVRSVARRARWTWQCWRMRCPSRIRRSARAMMRASLVEWAVRKLERGLGTGR